MVAFLGPPWVLEGIANLFSDVPKRVSVVLASWTNFGALPEPVRGKVEGLP